MEVIKRDQDGHWHVEQEPKFEVGEKVIHIKPDGITRHIVIINGRSFHPDDIWYEYKEDGAFGTVHGWFGESCFEKIKEEKKMGEAERIWITLDADMLNDCGNIKKQRRPHPKKMLDDLGIEKVILSEKRGKAVTYVELKDGRKGKATQDIKDTPDPYVGIAIATLSAMTGSKVNFRNMVDFLVKKGQYLRK